MADSELANALKNFWFRAQSASMKERKTALRNVAEIMSNPGITENIIRGICKVLQIILIQYDDHLSNACVRDVVIQLVKYHCDWTMKHLTSSLAELASKYKATYPTSNTAKSGLYALNLTCEMVKHGIKNSSDNSKAEFQKLVETQAALFYVVVAANNQKLSAKAKRCIFLMWSHVKNSEDLYENALKSAAEPGGHIVVFGSEFIHHLSSTKNNRVLNKLKGVLIDMFIKVAVSCKTKPAYFIINECGALLKHVTHEEFQQSLLPAMQKAMLRNPEIILECVGTIMAGLSLDLSQYALEIGKNLVANLHSKDDSAREAAVIACRSLASQCSDVSSLESLLQHLFDVFNGSEGKLTVATHKISVLEGAGNLSYNAVTGAAVHKLAVCAAEHFIKVLDTEVHEKTLVQALDMLSLWCVKFCNEVPKKVMDCFKTGPTKKNSSTAVRIAYIGCMSHCFVGNTLSQGTELVPYLARTVEKAVSQATQIPVVTEALAASCLLLKLSSSENVADYNLNNFFNIILDMEKQLFVSDKFLTLASEDGDIQGKAQDMCS